MSIDPQRKVLVFRDEKGEVFYVCEHGTEEYRRVMQALEMFAFIRYNPQAKKLLFAREKNEKPVKSIGASDRKLIRKCITRSDKRYNMSQAATALGVHRQTIYYWIKKGWVKPKRDYRNYPVFTVLDTENLLKWKNTIKR